MRLCAVLFVLLAVAARRDGGGQTPDPVQAPVTVAAREPPARVLAVVGATGPEHAAVRSALARLGADNRLARVRFDDDGPRDGAHTGPRRELVVVPHKGRNKDEARWQAMVVAGDDLATLRRRGETIDWIATPVSGGVASGRAPPARSRAEVVQVARQIAARARLAGIDVRDVTAYALGPGAIRVTVRMTTRELLAGSIEQALERLVNGAVPNRKPFSLYLRVVDARGAPVFAHARWIIPGGEGRSTGPLEVEGAPALPTRLHLRIAEGRTSRTHVFFLDCAGGRARSQTRPPCASRSARTG